MTPTLPRVSILCLAALLVPACAGGSGSDLASSTAAPSPPSSPPPPDLPPPPEPCEAPITDDCVLEGVYTLTFDEYGMSGGRQSAHKLFVHGGMSGGGWVNLKDGEYRFAGGTGIAGTTLVVWDRLVSDVHIHHDYTGLGFAGESELWLLGTVQGNVVNEERLNLTCWSGIHGCASVPQQRIDGNYTQLAEGVLETVLGRHLQVTGTAALDGWLLLARGDAQYVLPTAPSSVLVLHADDGVSGAFDGWSTTSLFLEGALRYTASDVFFDATRISLQAASASNGISDPLSLASASNLDSALAGADRFALLPRTALDDAQRSFLASAASLLWLQDPAQAKRSFDSLAGHAHTTMQEALHRRSAEASAQLDARLASQAYDYGTVWWADAARAHAPGHGLGGPATGLDRWLSPRLLVGGSVSGGRAALQVDRLGGVGEGESPAAAFHAHYRGDGWHLNGVLGAGRTWLQLQRPIEPGADGRHVAHSQRSFEHGFLHGEIGGAVPLGAGSLVPFLALDYSRARSDAFAEQGDTGFELVAGPSRSTRLSAAVGARYARDWTIGRQRLRLELDARFHRDVIDDTTLRAAFRGVPDVGFALPGERKAGGGALRVGLGGDIGRYSQWRMDYADGADDRRDRSWMLALRHAF
ncbi:autotransporter outer membrane beta-barrel domain-containing protein [Luteimonas sp. MC1572]|uniref:autotransporter outer membrane beta-barrel domain-containing protein n=1 Tax=Luteimonas sp. MC1572 TaxID=2799325 RepID=UPI0018F0E183|nr:autotransporter outer membrane beta-barrel domain-containing protein [Luteimonas sp. MC1572]MBJ6981580.1 autotransporter domain-containing protein [Luteimonas sp. MC1572]QQO02878.1 autotransporter domain-containing protein [Luteimonas sp. MC1572]